jgi:hypothetical protein
VSGEERERASKEGESWVNHKLRQRKNARAAMDEGKEKAPMHREVAYLKRRKLTKYKH